LPAEWQVNGERLPKMLAKLGTPGTAGKLSKVGKPETVCREANYSRDASNSMDDSSSRDVRKPTVEKPATAGTPAA